METQKHTIWHKRGSITARMRKAIIAAVIIAVCSIIALPARAQQPTEIVDSIEVKVLFPVSKTQVNLDYMGNGQRLYDFFRKLNEVDTCPDWTMTRIDLVGFASPEGPYELNQRLARQRASNLAKYLNAHTSLPDSLFNIRNRGIDWDGLAEAVKATEMEYKDEVLNIIYNEPEITYEPGTHRMVRSRKQQLQNFKGGRPWAWMLKNLYPYLRSAASVVCYIVRQEPAPEEAVDSAALIVPELPISPSEPDTQPAEEEEAPLPISPETLRYPIFALRSNLLVPFLNVGLEVPVSKHWTVGADYYYPWIWPAKNNKNCFELIFISAEARYWFDASSKQQMPERNYLVGHSVGLYGAWGYYDFERNYHGHQGHGWSLGVDYLYALPIAKGNLRLEFQVAVGALWSPKAQPYNVYEDGGHLIRETGHRKNFSYFGPTKIGVSLVVPIFRKVKQSAPIVP